MASRKKTRYELPTAVPTPDRRPAAMTKKIQQIEGTRNRLWMIQPVRDRRLLITYWARRS